MLQNSCRKESGLEVGKSKIKVLEDPVQCLVRAVFLIHGWPCSYNLTGQEGRGSSLGPFLIRALIPFVGVYSHDLITYFQMGIRLQHTNWVVGGGRDTNIQSIACIMAMGSISDVVFWEGGGLYGKYTAQFA